MKLDLAFLYRAEVRLKGRSKNRPAFENRPGAVTIDIPEATSKEAPIAVEWRGGGRDENRVHFPLRLHDGRLYRRVDLGIDRGVKDIEFLRASAGEPYRKWGLSGLPAYWGDTRNVPLEGDPTIGEVLSTNRSEHERAIAKWASENLLVEGVLYEPTAEPRLFFRAEARSRRMGVSFDYPKWKFGVVDGTDQIAFRLDEIDKARTVAETCGFADMGAPDLRVFIPEALKLPTERETLAAAALQLCRAAQNARYVQVQLESGKRLATLGKTWPTGPNIPEPYDLEKDAWKLNGLIADATTPEAMMEEACAKIADQIEGVLDNFADLIDLEPKQAWAIPLARSALEGWRNELQIESLNPKSPST